MESASVKQKVKELIPDNDESKMLFEALRTYQANQDLDALLVSLRSLLNEPNKLELYDCMRPLILLRHQLEYSKRAPPVPGVKLRTIRLLCNPGESLGFAVRGGYEHGVGVFVTQVTSGSQAYRQGLREGDEIVRVNGFTIAEAIHDDVLNLIKSRDEINLKVTYIGMLPVKDDPSGPVTWQYIDSSSDNSDEETRPPQDIKIFIDCSGHASIGCSIVSESGPTARFPGIFVEKVKPGSLAEEVGFEPGDQILEVNETSFRKITWKEAVMALKSSRQLHMVIHKKVGSKLVQRLSSSLSQDTAKTNGTSYQNSSNSPAANQFTPTPVPDNSEPIYSTVNKVSPQPSPDSAERSMSRSRYEVSALDEVEMIRQQLEMMHKPPPLPPSPAFSSHSERSSVVSTAAEVHAPNPPDNNQSPFSLNDSSTSYDSSQSHSQLSPLGGAAARMMERKLHSTSNTASLLGAEGDFDWTENVSDNVYNMIDSDDVDGRSLKSLTYRKNLDLGVAVEGGLGSPLGGKILVAVVYEDGVGKKSGKLRVGDQLMMINGQPLVGLTCDQAEKIIRETAKTAKETVELIYCESTLINDEDSVTYF